MSVADKRALTEIVLWSMALAWVWICFTAGWEMAGQSFGLTVVEQGAGRVFMVDLGVGILAAIVHVIASEAFARGRAMPLDLATPTGVVFALHRAA